jgi:hypothetical protein
VKIPPYIRQLKGFEELRMLRNRVRDSYNSLKHRTVSGAKQLKESQLLEYFNQDYKLTEAEKKRTTSVYP